MREEKRSHDCRDGLRAALKKTNKQIAFGTVSFCPSPFFHLLLDTLAQQSLLPSERADDGEIGSADRIFSSSSSNRRGERFEKKMKNLSPHSKKEKKENSPAKTGKNEPLDNLPPRSHQARALDCRAQPGKCREVAREKECKREETTKGSFSLGKRLLVSLLPRLLLNQAFSFPSFPHTTQT